MFTRSLRLPKSGVETFFLWGPRQAGKTTLLKAVYPDALWIDLLKADEYRRYLQNPELLRAEIAAQKAIRQVVIDEVQKVPPLLDEAHWLHENRGIRFALCGSSARKVKRGHANLLGGRAVRYELHGLTAAEIGREFDLNRMLNHGYLPTIYLSDRPERLLNSYVADYLKEEVAAEGLVRNLPVFSEFLNAASLSDAELVNFSTIARDCGVSSPTIRGYFQILEDTLLGRWLPAYVKRPKRRVIAVVFQLIPGQGMELLANTEEATERHDGVDGLTAHLVEHDVIDPAELLAGRVVDGSSLDLVGGNQGAGSHLRLGVQFGVWRSMRAPDCVQTWKRPVVVAVPAGARPTHAPLLEVSRLIRPVTLCGEA